MVPGVPNTTVGNVSRTHRPCGVCRALVVACPHTKASPEAVAAERTRQLAVKRNQRAKSKAARELEVALAQMRRAGIVR